jgi:tripartite-type tricarboxylate transporter receptor subunit TctC
MIATLRMTACALAALACAGTALAQNFPTRPMRVLVPLAAGGGMDSVTRSVAAGLGESFGQTVVVDNRPGAGSLVSLQTLNDAAPDGHTLMMISATTVIYPLLYKSPLDPVRDFAPVSQVTAQGYILVVHPGLPVKTALDLVKYAKANPEKLTYASSGIGSPIHMTTELMQIATGTKMTHVPYKGMGAAYTDLLAGRISFSFATIISSQPHLKTGRLRAVAVSTARRAPAMPEIPTMAEAGVPGVVVVNWYGLIAPRAVPRPVIDRIATETARAVRAPAMEKHLLTDGSEAVGSTAAEFTAHIRAESEQWRRVIKQGGIKAQ